MPFTASDASSKTKRARTPAQQKQWAAVANDVLKRGGSDASAIRQANAVIRSRRQRSKG